MYLNSLRIFLLLTIVFSGLFAQEKNEPYWHANPSPSLLDVRVLAVDSSDNIFAAIWGDGIYKSANKGLTWQKINSGLTNLYVNCIEIQKNGTIYAGTMGGGVFVSINGSSWSQKNNGLGSLVVKSIGIAYDNVVYAGTYGHGVFKSIDGGDTWTQASEGIAFRDINCLVVARDSAVVAGTNGGGLFKSTNEGATWYPAGSNLKSKVINDFVKTEFGDIYTITYGGGVYISYSNGSDWQTYFHSMKDMPLFGKCIAAYDDQNPIIGMEYNGLIRFNILYAGIPGETAWRKTSKKFMGINDIIITSDKQIFIAEPFVGIFRSTDNGMTFTDSIGFYQEFIDKGIKPLFAYQNGLMFSSSISGGIYKSTDKGVTWTLKALDNVKINMYNSDENGILYAATESGPYKSTDAGEKWTKLNWNNPVYSIAAAGTTIFIADSAIRKSTDGGNSWAIKGHYMDGMKLTFICIDDNGYLYTNMYKFGTGDPPTNLSGLYRSVNNGDTWTRIVAQDSYFVLNMTIHENKLYCGVIGGMIISTNQGGNWAFTNLGLTDPNINEIQFSKSGDMILVDGSSQYVVRSTDGGTTCDTLREGAVRAEIMDLAVNSDGDIFLGTSCLYRGIQGTDLEAPALIVPDDNKGGVELHPLLSWSSVANCDMYEVQVALDAEFSEMAESAVTGDSKWRIYKGLENGLHYFWRARSKRNKSVSAWSETRSFFTVIAAPELKFPEDSSYSIDTNITFLWNKVDEAGTYQIQVSKDEGFKDIYLDKDKLTLPSCLSGKMATGTQYWWRVKSKSFMSNSDWSEAWVFTTKFAAPLLKKPTDKAITQNADVVLSWSAVAGATEYNVVIASDAGLKNVLFDGKSSGDSSHAYGMYEVGKTYYWKVRARDAKNEGYWSEVRSFTISQSELALRYPENNARYVPNDVNFEWIGPAAVDGYHIQISKEEDFKNILLEDASVTGFTKLVENLDYGYYYWRVRYKLGSNYSEWTDVWVFMTDPGRPVLLSPSDKSPSEANPVKLQWDGPKHAEEFMLEVARDTEFKDIVHKKDKLTEKSYTLPTLKNFEKLYWRVRFLVNKDTSMWSDTWAFTTELQRTYLKGPGDNLENSELTLQFFWNKVPNAEFYELQLAYDTEFGNIYNTFDEIADTFKVVADLDTSRTYFWRVRAKYSAGAGPWSVVWKFRTKATRIGVDEEYIARVVIPLSYPNPLFGSAVLEWGAEAPESTRIDIIDISGAKVMDLFEGISAPGRNYLRWDASALPAGTYFYRLKLGNREVFYKILK